RHRECPVRWYESAESLAMVAWGAIRPFAWPREARPRGKAPAADWPARWPGSQPRWARGDAVAHCAVEPSWPRPQAAPESRLPIHAVAPRTALRSSGQVQAYEAKRARRMA